MSDHSRRQLLAISGTGITAAFAGCASLAENVSNGSEDELDIAGRVEEFTEGDLGPVTVGAVPPQEEMAALEEGFAEKQNELLEKMENGDLDQEEVQQEMQAIQQDAQERQRELVVDAAEVIERYVEEADDLSLEESETEMGLALIDGDPASILGLLTTPEVGGVFPEEEYQNNLTL